MNSTHPQKQVLLITLQAPEAQVKPTALLEQKLRDSGFGLTQIDASNLESLEASGATNYRFDAVVIGPQVINAIVAARQVRALWPRQPILFTPLPKHRAELESALRHTPLIGTNWFVLNPGDPNLTDRLHEAIQTSKRRDQLQSVLNAARTQTTYPSSPETSDYQRLLLQVETLTQEKQRQQRLYEAVLSSSVDQSYIYNLNKHLIYANPAAAEQLEIPLSQIIGRGVDELGFTPEVRKKLSKDIDQVIRTLKPIRAEMPFTSPSGKKRVYEYVLSPVLDQQGAVEAVVEITRDITERKHSSERVWREANYDALTGLPNRRLFRDRLNQEIRHAQRSGSPLALFFIGLDHFKQVNDLHGHDAGDELLVQVARRLSNSIRQSDTVARLGGDEFTVILTELDGKSHIEKIARKVLAELARPFKLSRAIVHVSGSIGITLYPTDTTQAEDLIRNADQAMYTAKNNGRNQFHFFTRRLQDEALRRLQLIDDLRTALAEDQIRLYFQPIVDLHEGHICKAEALVRWEHPNEGLLSPALFIPLAEESKQINQLGDWVFKQATEYCRSWSETLGHPFQVSLNKSPLQFINQNHRSWVRHLKKMGLKQHSVTVEITEGVLLNPSAAVSASLQAFQEAGIELAIDDFGTGYASMAYLQKYHVDYLKIDQSFVQDMITNRNSRTIVEGIIAMAHKLGLKVIAEGIETPEQRDTLRAIGCDYGQGFLFSKPIPAAGFRHLLLHWHQ